MDGKFYLPHAQVTRWRIFHLFVSCLLLWSGLLWVGHGHSWAQVTSQVSNNTDIPASPQADTIPTLSVIHGQVWKDSNWDGLYQLGEPFLPYTVVALYPLSGAQSPSAMAQATPLVTATTTITGWYSLPEIAPGVYYLDFVTAGAMFPTVSRDNANEEVNSDVLATNVVSHGRYTPLTVTDVGQRLRINAGFVPAAQATVYVYEDSNQDQNRQSDEPPLPGSIVILYDSLGKELTRRIVDAKGAVTFAALAPGSYAVGLWPPEGYFVDVTATLELPLLQPGSANRFSAPVASSPKVITLVKFTAEVQDATLVIRWLTSSEQDTYGYRLVRQDTTATAATVQLTPQIIPSQGIFGGSYEVRLPYNPLDDGPTTAMAFILVEYEFTGRQNSYGPFSVTQPLANRLFLPLITATK